jgi:hypothetical protein
LARQDVRARTYRPVQAVHRKQARRPCQAPRPGAERIATPPTPRLGPELLFLPKTTTPQLSGAPNTKRGRSRRRARPQTTLLLLSLSRPGTVQACELIDSRRAHATESLTLSLASSLRYLPSSSSASPARAASSTGTRARTAEIWSPYGLPQQRRRPASQPSRRAAPSLPLLRRCTHR